MKILGIKKCPGCGALYGADDKFCTKCGRDLISMTFGWMTFRHWWKSQPYRLKGGIIGASLLPLSWVLVLFINVLSRLLSNENPILRILAPIFLIPAIFILQFPLIIPLLLNLRTLVTKGCGPFGCEPEILGYIFIVLFWIFIGALIGWIIDKVKARKKDVE